MQTISIISLKGGVAKTTTAVNMAYTLAEVHKGHEKSAVVADFMAQQTAAQNK